MKLQWEREMGSGSAQSRRVHPIFFHHPVAEGALQNGGSIALNGGGEWKKGGS
jgi:hypothetical protein